MPWLRFANIHISTKRSNKGSSPLY
jgi:hypothetical protein